MINLNKEIDNMICDYEITDEEFPDKLAGFFIANNWFGEEPQAIDGTVYVSDAFIKKHRGQIDTFCNCFNKPAEEKAHILWKRLHRSFKITAEYWDEYEKKFNVRPEFTCVIMDFLLTYLVGGLEDSLDNEIKELVEDAFDNLPKVYGDVLTDFINWSREEKHTLYYNTYFLPQYYEDEFNGAYDEDYYLRIMYCMFNQDYILENDMYQQAASSKNYADTWLFISLHFLCALRATDLKRICHPILPMSPEEVLKRVEEGTFLEEDALFTLNSVLKHLNSLRLMPNKTEGTTGIGSIKFHVPVSAEAHIGILFAVCEAHFQLSDKRPELPLIRVIRSYEQINRYMGEEIGDLFLASDFHTRAANKSYLQMIYLLTDDILDDVTDEYHVNGYMLAALARSHKGGYGKFASTTKRYLEDAKLSGYSEEFVTRELMERGVLSSIPYRLLEMVAGDKYRKLSERNQTKVIQELGFSPLEAENAVSVMEKSIKRSTQIVAAVYQSHTREDIMKILHHIGNGDAVSKTNESMCFVTAMGSICPYADRNNCIGCQYEIGTRSTILLMAKEVKRLEKLYKDSDNEFEKRKYKDIAVNIVAPKINDLLTCMQEEYGEEAADTMRNVILEVNNVEG